MIEQEAKVLNFQRCPNCSKSMTGTTCGHCGFEQNKDLNPPVQNEKSGVERMINARDNDELRARISYLEGEVTRLKNDLDKTKREKVSIQSLVEAAAQDLVKVRNNLLNLRITDD